MKYSPTILRSECFRKTKNPLKLPSQRFSLYPALYFHDQSRNIPFQGPENNFRLPQNFHIFCVMKYFLKILRREFFLENRRSAKIPLKFSIQRFLRYSLVRFQRQPQRRLILKSPKLLYLDNLPQYQTISRQRTPDHSNIPSKSSFSSSLLRKIWIRGRTARGI